jgi:exonuclease VII large subunit
MKLTKQQLKQIITEEVQKALNERRVPGLVGEGALADRIAAATARVRKEREASQERAVATRAKPSKKAMAEKKKWLEKNYIAKYLAKGYKRTNALPKLPGLKVGPTSATKNGYAITFNKFPIVLISTRGIRGVQKITWNVTEGQFRNAIDDTIMAVLVK